MQDSDSSSWQHCQIMVTLSKKMWPQILTKLPSTFRVLYSPKGISGQLALPDLEKLDQFEKENPIFFCTKNLPSI